MSLPEKLCLAPFRSVYLNGGVARPCCWYDRSELVNRNTGIQDVSEIFYSKEFSDIREKMLKGESLPGCKRCIKHEEIGGKSHRMFWNSREFSDYKTDDTRYGLKALDIYLGNLCNLKCVSCDSYNSSSWISDEVALDGKAKQNYIEKFEVQNLKREVFENVEWLKLAGGETLFMPEHEKLLDFLIKENLSKNITLGYVCNNTIDPQKFLPKWEKFKKIRILLSVDGVGRVNEYTRYPSLWEKNKEIIDKYLSLGALVDVEVNTVVSLLNVFHLPELNNWWEAISNNKPIFYRLIDRPDHLRVQRLPLKLREELVEKIENISSLGHIKKEILSSDLEEGFDQSLKWLEKLDGLRKVSLKEINPQYFK